METVARLGADIMAAIGRQLRLMYAEIVAQGVPEHFAEILHRLDERMDEGSKNEPPAASSASSQHVSRDEGLQNDSETHESSALALHRGAHSHCSPATARGLTEALTLSLGFAREIAEVDVVLARR